MDDMDSYLTTVDELVHDENKIVSYKLLTHQLALPVKQAKKLLTFYVKNNENEKLLVVYSLTGETNKGVCISLVKKEELKTAKTKLKAVLSCHPYSVQKAQLNDANPLYAADLSLTKQVLYQCGSSGNIKFDGGHKLTNDDIKQIREKMNCANVSKAGSKVEKKSLIKKTSQKNVTSLFGPKKSSSDEKKESLNKHTRAEKCSDQDKAVAACRNNGVEEDGKSKSQIGSAVPDKASLRGKSSTAKPKGMSMFMTKGKTDLFASSKKGPSANSRKESSTQSSIDADSAKEIINTDEVSDSGHEVKGVKSKTEPLEELEVIKDTPSATLKKSSRNKSRTKNKQSRATFGELPAKKRRRIQEIFSSSEESDDEQNFVESDIIPPSPVAAKPATKTGVIKVGEKNSRKKRVLKSKTFVDSDGSMLTEKVWEEVSCSSEEEESTNLASDKKAEENKYPPSSKTEARISQVDKAPAKKQKQSSIMGFFAKKS